mgnify:CR=1 FL=1
MANTFKIKVAGETHEFEQSLGNLNSGLKMLKSEARSLNKSLKVDPQNTDTASKLYDNLTQQLELTHKKAEEVKKSLANIDPKVDLKGFVSAQNQLRNLQTESKKLESALSAVSSKPHKLNLHFPHLDVQRVIGPLLSSIQSSAHAVGNAVLSPIKNSAHAVGDALLSSIQNSAHAVGGALSGAIKSGLSSAKSIAISAGHGIAKGLTVPLSSVRGLISGIKPVISSIKSSAHNVGAAFSGAVKSGLSGAKSAAISAGHSIAKGLTAPLSQVRQRLNEVVIGGLRQIGASAVSKAGDAFSNITKSMQDTQTATNGLKKVMQFRGIASQFDDLRKSLSQTAINTNIDTKTAEKFGSVLIGVGKQASETAKIVDAAANANQAFGGSGEAFESVSLALGQIEAAGKVTADNMNQITDANSALGAALKSQVFENYQKAGGAAKSFNDAMSKGEITTDDLTNALIELSSKGGKAVQTLPDAFASLEETIGTKLQPVFDALTKALIPVINHVTDLVQSMDFTSVAEKISSINFMQIFAGIGDAITPVLTLVTRLKSAIARAFTEMTGKPATLGNAFSVMGSMISAAVNPISNIFSFLLGQAEKLQNALSQAFHSVDSGVLVGTFNTVGAAIETVIDTATTGVATFIKSININALLEGIQRIAQMIAQIAQSINFSAIFSAISNGLSFLLGQVEKLANALFQAFHNIDSGVLVGTFRTVGAALETVIDTLTTGVATLIQSININAILEGIQRIAQTIAQIAQGINFSAIFGTISNGLSFLLGQAEKLKNALFQAFHNVDSGVLINTFKAVGAAIETVIDTATTGVADIIQSININAILKVVQRIAQTIAQMARDIDFSAVLSVISNSFSFLLSQAKKLKNALFQAFHNVDSSLLVNTFKAVGGAIKAIIDTATTGVAKLIQSININAILKVIQRFAQTITQMLQNIDFSVVSNGLSFLLTQAKKLKNALFQAFHNVDSSLLVNTLKTIGGAIKAIIGAVTNGLVKVIQSININAILKVIQLIAQTITRMAQNTDFSAISNGLSFLKNQAEKLKNALSQAFHNVDSSVVVGTFNAIGGAIESVIDTTTTGLANAIQSININAILEGVKSFVSTFAQTFAQLADTVTPIAAQLGSAFSQAFSTLAPGQLQSSFESIVTGALTMFQTLAGIVANAVSQIDLSPIVNAFKNVGKIFTMLSQSISDSGLGKALASIFSGAINAAGRLLSSTTGMAHGILRAFQPLLKGLRPVMDGISSLFHAVFGTVSKVWNAISKDITKLVSAFMKEATPGLKETFKSLKPLLKAIGKLFSSLGNIIIWICNHVITPILVPAFKILGKMIGWLAKIIAGPIDVITACIKGLVWAFDKLKDGLKAIEKPINDFMTGAGKKLGEIGDKIGKFFGVKNGLGLDAKIRNYKSDVSNSMLIKNNDATINVTPAMGQNPEAIAREVARLIRAGAV